MRKHINLIKIILLVIAAPYLIWNLAISKTYKLEVSNKQLKEEIRALNEEPDKKINKSHKGVQINEKIISNGKLLDYIAANLDSETKVVGYTPNLINKDKESCLYIADMEISGNFINLLRIVKEIETGQLPIKILSLKFEAKKEENEGIRILMLNMIVAQVE